MSTNVELMSTHGQEHDRAEQRLHEALVEQDRSHERYDAAVGGSALLLAAVGASHAGARRWRRAMPG